MVDQALRNQLDQWVDAHRDEFVKDVIDVVNIPSVSVQTEGKYPYGQPCAQMLDFILALSEKYGFPTRNYEYQCGECWMEGTEGKYEIGLFGHTDVVAVGSGWNYEPFSAIEKDGHIIGRGSKDDKGPTIACLYALRFLKENHIPMKNRLRMLYGCNEESGMNDAIYFAQHYRCPDFTFVPEAKFPGVYAEMGVIKLEPYKKLESGNLISIDAGGSNSVVPNLATLVLKDITVEQAKQALQGDEVEVEADGANVRLTAHGISRHAAFPEGAVNALAVLLQAVKKADLLTGDAKEAAAFLDLPLQDFYAKAMHLDHVDETGALSCIVTRIRMEEGRVLKPTLTIFYGATQSPEDVEKDFRQLIAKGGFQLDDGFYHFPPLYESKDDPIFKIMKQATTEVLHKEYEPFAMAGRTYAARFPYALAVGSAIQDRPQQLMKTSGYGGPHEPDECCEIEMLLNSIRIYVLALLETDEQMEEIMRIRAEKASQNG